VRNRQQRISPALLETWLDDVLAKGRGDKVDVLQAHACSKKGLTAFKMGRVDLAQAGLSSQDVDRIYQSMYVYSAGFNDMLRVRRGSEWKGVQWKG